MGGVFETYFGIKPNQHLMDTPNFELHLGSDESGNRSLGYKINTKLL